MTWSEKAFWLERITFYLPLAIRYPIYRRNLEYALYAYLRRCGS